MNQLLPGGQGGDWEDYNRLKANTYDPAIRSIFDSFRYADLQDPSDRLVVEALAVLNDVQLFARCNQHTYRVRAEFRLIDAINAVLTSYDLPVDQPDALTTPDGNVVWLWPVYAKPEKKARAKDDDEGEDAGEDGDALGEELEEIEEPHAEWWQVSRRDNIVEAARWEVRDWEEMETAFPFNRTGTKDEDAAIESVPLTPMACYETKGMAMARLEKLYRQKQWEIEHGCHYDSAPLLDDLAKPPEARLKGDVTSLYPPAGRRALMYCATTPESHHAHIQSVNAESVQSKYGGTNLNPDTVAQIAAVRDKLK